MASLRTQLKRLESLRETSGAPAAREKLQLLAELEHKSLGRAQNFAGFARFLASRNSGHLY